MRTPIMDTPLPNPQQTASRTVGARYGIDRLDSRAE